MSDQLRVVILGHVDHGKSTLIGRLFLDSGAMPDGRYEQLVASARRRGTPVELANLTDALQAERDQNVTIDTSQVWFTWAGREYVFIDAPGHREFLRNMVTGASRADAALIVIDAVEGIQEQSRRHGFLARVLGLAQVSVVVNKMDLAGYSQEVFDRIAAGYRAFLEDIGLTAVAIVPASASTGANVTRRDEALTWFDGPTVIDALAGFSPPLRRGGGPLRLPLQAVYRFDHRRIVAGRIESGSVAVGDPLVFLPSGKRSVVKTIERWPEGHEDTARAGESIGITLGAQIFVERGEIAAAPDAPPHVVSEFDARLFWLGRSPLECGRPYRLKLTTQEVGCQIVRIARAIDAASLAEKASPQAVERDQAADVTIRVASPIAVDRFSDVIATGRFVLVDGEEVSGGGVILALPSADVRVPAAVIRSVGEVERDEREARNGHRGAVVWLTGLSGSGKSTLANAVERELFDRGMQVFVLDGDNVRLGLSGDLGFSAADRAENIRRVAQAAKLFAEAGMVVITALISPYRSDRLRARAIMKEGGLDIPFVEVFLDVPVEVCRARDPKGLYLRAQSGEIREFTGVSAPYEAPEAPEVVLRTADRTVEACVEELLARLLPIVGQPPRTG